MAKAILKYTDSNDNSGTKNFPNLNPSYVPAYGESIAESQAYKIKKAVTALNSLTANSIVSIAVQVDYDITNVTSDDTVARSFITESEEGEENG